jgi:hypothetical protein
MTTAFDFEEYDHIAAAAAKLSGGGLGGGGGGLAGSGQVAGGGSGPGAAAPSPEAASYLLAAASRGAVGVMEAHGAAPQWASETADVLGSPTVVQAMDLALSGLPSAGVDPPILARQIANVGADISPTNLRAYSPALLRRIEALFKHQPHTEHHEQHAEPTFATMPRRRLSEDEQHAMVWDAMMGWMIHEHAAPLSDAGPPDRSRRLIKRAKDLDANDVPPTWTVEETATAFAIPDAPTSMSWVNTDGTWRCIDWPGVKPVTSARILQSCRRC